MKTIVQRGDENKECSDSNKDEDNSPESVTWEDEDESGFLFLSTKSAFDF